MHLRAHAPIRTRARACPRERPAPATRAIRCIQQYLRDPCPEPNYACTPLLELATDGKPQSKQKSADLFALLLGSGQTLLATTRGLGLVLGLGQSRAKLQAIRVIRLQLTRLGSGSGSAVLREGGGGAGNDPSAAGSAQAGADTAARAHCTLLPALVECATPPAAATPTRLMAEAADCAVHLAVKFTDLGHAAVLSAFDRDVHRWVPPGLPVCLPGALPSLASLAPAQPYGAHSWRTQLAHAAGARPACCRER